MSDDLTYPAQAYRSAIAFGQKKQQEQLSLLEENERLRRQLTITGSTLHLTLQHEGSPRDCKRFACEQWLPLVEWEAEAKDG